MLDADGKPLQVNVPDTVLDNLSELFKNFPDGRYKISVIEPGEPRPRLLLDVNLRGGKPADDAEDGDKPPTEDDAGAAQLGEPQSPLAAGSTESDPQAEITHQLLTDPLAVVAGGVDSAAPQVAVVRDGHEEQDRTGEQQPGEGEIVMPASRSERAVYEAALSLGALAALSGGRDWGERVDEALAEVGNGALSKASRLARRIMQPSNETQRPGGRKPKPR
jgi:hypothetical protein